MPPADRFVDVLTTTVFPSMLGAGIVLLIILVIGRFLGRKLGPLAAGLGLLVGLTVGNYFSDGTIGYFKETPKYNWYGSNPGMPETTVRYTTVSTRKPGEAPIREKKLQITLPDAGYQWLPWAATILMLHGVLARSPGLPGYISVTIRIEATILATFMLFPSDWLLQHSRLMILFMVVSFTQWQILDKLTHQRPGCGYALSMSFLLAAGGFLAAYQFMTLFYWCVILSQGFRI